MKKIISLITVIMLAVTVFAMTAIAFPSPDVDKNAWKESDSFSPTKFDVSKASSSITIDGEATVDSGYGSNKVMVAGLTDYNSMDSSDGATGSAYLAWDADYIYIHFMVEDTTKHLGEDFNSDSVEIYLDYDQKADGKKVKWNKLQSSDTFAAQYRIQRGTKQKAATVSLSNNESMTYVGEKSKVAVKEVTGGYVVEAAFPLKNSSGKYLPVSNNIGFELQINDNPDGYARMSGAYIQGGIQAYVYEYTHLMDTIVLKSASDITWNTRTPQKDINDTLAEFDPNSKAPSKTPSKASSATSSKASSASSSKVSSAAVSNPSSAASAAASENTVSSEIENTVSNEDANKGDTDTPNEDATDNDDTTTIGASTDEDKGGLPMGALIGIIAGAVVLLGGGAAAVIIILKKKKQA